MTEQELQDILNKCPWMTLLTYGGNDFLGVVQNVDETITTIYDFGALKSTEQKVTFLALSEDWWYTSNRLIPINIFLKQEWAVFRPTLKTLNSKDVEIKFGPHISLTELAMKKSKRRSITLVRKM
jgi:hypothetical protein